MPCRERWGGLEAEGFGIVFLEAAAAGVPAVAGRSGGSHEAVVDGETGFVVSGRALDVRAAIEALLADDALRARMGDAARRRAVAEFSYDSLAARLAPVVAGDLAGLGALT
jgi:phosphatidylinositol alpha-1,6-mannosyltransferase